MQSSKLLTGWKKQKPELNNVYSQVLQDAQARVDLAFRAFFRRVNAGEKTGYPRFKGYKRYDSLTYKQFGFKLGVNKLYLSKIGPVKVKMHRPIEGKIRRVTIRRNSRGKFFVSIVANVEAKMALFKGDSVVGVDVGLESFATLSTGEKIVNPRFYRKEEAQLVRAQRKLSSERKGSVQWCKRLRVVERVHERIGNKRTDFVHQESRRHFTSL